MSRCSDSNSDSTVHRRITRLTPLYHFMCLASAIAASSTATARAPVSSPTYVLTAAHCVSDGVVNWIAVGSGAAYTYQSETIRVVPNSIVLHPAFRKPYAYSNDAAIFQIKASPIAQPVVLDSSFDFTGRPSASLYSFLRPSAINEVKLLSLGVWSRKDCAAKYANVNASVLCAGGKAGVDACQGDSGSPLTVADISGKDTLIGLVSSGFQCGLTGVPGFYTRIPSLAAFIQQNVVKATWNKPIVSSRSDESTNSPAPVQTVAVSTPTPSPSSGATITPIGSPASNSSTVDTFSNNTATSTQPVPVPSSPQADTIDEKSLNDLSPITQSKVVGQLIGGDDTTTATIFKELRDQLVNPRNKVTLYSSGGMDALPLNQRPDRFDTISAGAAAAVAPETQACAV